MSKYLFLKNNADDFKLSLSYFVGVAANKAMTNFKNFKNLLKIQINVKLKKGSVLAPR